MPQRSSWALGPMLGFDTETTGVEVETDIAVTISLVWTEPDREPVAHEWLIDPGDREIPASATEVHGITTEHARQHGMPPAEAWGQAHELLTKLWQPDIPLVAFNGAFDLTLGDRELARWLGTAMPATLPTRQGDGLAAGLAMVDPLIIDRAQDRYRKGGRKLGQMCEHYGVRLDQAHNSTEDVLGTLRLAYMLAKMYPGSVGYVDLATLHCHQYRWNRTWCTRMAQWIAGEADKMERAWSAKNLVFLRQKLAKLEITDEPTDELIAATVASTRERAADIAANADCWPMRVRPIDHGLRPGDANCRTGGTTPS